MMIDWNDILGKILALFVSGGVGYLLIDRFFLGKREKEDVKHQQIENVKQAVDYGIPMITIYEEIRKIVVKETEPIQTKLDKALARIDNLENNWCCYKKNCPERIRNAQDADIENNLNILDNESKKTICNSR